MNYVFKSRYGLFAKREFILARLSLFWNLSIKQPNFAKSLSHIFHSCPFHITPSSPFVFKKVLRRCNFIATKKVPRSVFGSSRAPVKFTGKNGVIRNTKRSFREFYETVFRPERSGLLRNAHLVVIIINKKLSEISCSKRRFGSSQVWIITYARIQVQSVSMNRPFPSYPLPLFQNESTYETIHMKWVSHTRPFSCKSNSFSFEWFRT